MIYKPLKQILFFDCDSKNLLFQIDVIDGRAKWVETSKILSLKIQVSDKADNAEGINALNDLKNESAVFEVMLLTNKQDNTSKKVKFQEVTIKRLELRSATMSALDYPLTLRYFAEGYATEMSEF